MKITNLIFVTSKFCNSFGIMRLIIDFSFELASSLMRTLIRLIWLQAIFLLLSTLQHLLLCTWTCILTNFRREAERERGRKATWSANLADDYKTWSCVRELRLCGACGVGKEKLLMRVPLGESPCWLCCAGLPSGKPKLPVIGQSTFMHLAWP